MLSFQKSPVVDSLVKLETKKTCPNKERRERAVTSFHLAIDELENKVFCGLRVGSNLDLGHLMFPR